MWKAGDPVRPYRDSFAILYSRSLGEGKGANLCFRASFTDSEERIVNRVEGEVRDGGESGPILLKSPTSDALYAVWNAADPRRPLANLLRFAAWNSKQSTWSETLTINDDAAPATHTFQGATVAPDGSVDWRATRSFTLNRPAVQLFQRLPGGAKFRVEPLRGQV